MGRLRICLVAAEAAPFAKVGGLGDFTTALAQNLSQAGHDVRLFFPFYSTIDRRSLDYGPVDFLQDLEIEMDRPYRFSIMYTWLTNRHLQVYLVDCPDLYHRAAVYTQEPDEVIRFGLLCRAALESCQRMGWSPDIVHCNDWHTALIPTYLRTLYSWDEVLSAARTVLTLHNVGYQGVFGIEALQGLGLGDELAYFDGEDLRADRVNLLKTGLMHADQLTTVSPTHAREIQTPEFGMGLDDLLRARSDRLEGILNGVDYDEWNPATDPLIPFKYSPEDLSGKERNKRALLQDLSLPYDPQAPVLGVVSRLVEQKGIDLLASAMPGLLEQLDLRLVVLGTGEPKFESVFRSLHQQFPRKVSFYNGYSNELAHRIEAGSDLFLMPSLYEPCGLNQMYSLRYGTVPVVRATGGLADSVESWDPETGSGTGFLFGEYSAAAFLDALHRALDTFRDQPAWRQLMINGMGQDFSWTKQVGEYDTLYRKMLTRDEDRPSASLT